MLGIVNLILALPQMRSRGSLAILVCVFLLFPCAKMAEAADGFLGIRTGNVAGEFSMPFENQATTSVGGGAFDLGAFLGAEAYYGNPGAGVTGQNTITYNLEAGHVWNGHEALQHVTSFVNSADTWGAGVVAPLYDRHATWAAMLIGGRETPSGGVRQSGLAPDTELRSAAMATGWSGTAYALSFGISADSYVSAFANAFPVADVVNSSFGYTDAGGSNALTIFSDAMVFQNPATTYVTSAGNSGPGTNTVGAPGSGYNTITVGALGDANTFNSAASFSSRGPQDFAYYTSNGVVSIAGVRAAVDVAAPGASLTSAFYGGQTGGNNNTLAGSTNLGSDAAAYSASISGTSFAAPIVAGGAALVTSASKSLPGLAGNEEALSNLVVKSLLLNGADKTSGWSNGQALVNGVVSTSQSLDNTVGTGRMNLENTFQTQVRGQSGVDGTATGLQGGVQELGWDFGRAVLGFQNDYILTDPLVGNSTFTTTLAWHRIREWNPSTGELYETAQADLNLSLWRLGQSNTFDTLVAQSSSLYNTVEHLSFAIPETGLYGLRVGYSQNTFANFEDWGTTSFPQTYGLAWNGEAFTTLYWNASTNDAWNGLDANWTTSSNGTGGTARSTTTPYSTLVINSPGNETIVLGGARQAGGIVLNNGAQTFSGSLLPSLSIGAGGIHLASTADGPARFESSAPIIPTAAQTWSNSSSHNLIINGLVSGSADLEIEATSSGAVVWNGVQTRTGNTTVTQGRLMVNGDISAGGATTVASGGSLGGSGRIGNLLLQTGGTLEPGNSPGILSIEGDATWHGGGHYNWQALLDNPDAANQSGVGSGWDFIDISGSLTLSAFNTSSNRFHLNLWSLSAISPDQNGPVAGYNPAVGSTWLIARADGGITLNGSSLLSQTDYTSYFHVHTEAFNGTGGWLGILPANFQVVTLGDPNAIFLYAAPGSAAVPEPGQVAVSLLLLAGIGMYARWKR